MDAHRIGDLELVEKNLSKLLGRVDIELPLSDIENLRNVCQLNKYLSNE